MNDIQTIYYLNNILQHLNDSLNSYNLNKNEVTQPQLRATLKNICLDRNIMIDEIKFKIKELGGIPYSRKTITVTLHQWLQDIKNVITDADPITISKQIRMGESALIDSYLNALSENITPDIRQLLMNQLSKIEVGLEEMELESINAQ